MIVANDYPFLDLMWTMIVFFAWILWIWLVIVVLSDLFRRHDASGGKKVLWTLFIIFLPLLGVLVYLVANGDGMVDRSAQRERAAQSQFDDHARSVAGSVGATRGDRAREGAPRQRSDHAGRVRGHQGEGVDRLATRRAFERALAALRVSPLTLHRPIDHLASARHQR